jgi:PHD/YefM family antitoxin component YafN of YafNO toxin-antitoxin module
MNRTSHASKPASTPASNPSWTISTARQHLPELVASAAKEPQAIYRRNRLVATVISPEAFEELHAARKTSVGSAFARLRQICHEEGYEFVPASRHDRPNFFAAPTK